VRTRARGSGTANGRVLTTRFALAVKYAREALASGDLAKLQRADERLVKAHQRWADLLVANVTDDDVSNIEPVMGLTPAAAELLATRSRRLLAELSEARNLAIGSTVAEELTASLGSDLDELLSEGAGG
jgi:hypothetical protein